MVEETEFQPALHIVSPRDTPRRVPPMTVVRDLTEALRPELQVLGWEAREVRLQSAGNN